MQRIIVKNFGPIKYLDLEIKDLSLFIGEQATGKSTLARLVYIFKSLRGKWIEYLYKDDSQISFDINSSYAEAELQKCLTIDEIGWGFARYFGFSGQAEILYQYKQDRWLWVSPADDATYPAIEEFRSSPKQNVRDFSHVNAIEDICKQIVDFRRKYLGKEKAFASASKYREIEAEKKRKGIEIEGLINEFFGHDEEVFFIPAGRSLFATLSERAPSKGMELLLENFRDRITGLKPAFELSLSESIAEKKEKLRVEKLPQEDALNFAVEKIRGILKGDYRNDKEGEKIYFDERNYVKLSSASSGQQESVWILLQIFLLILNQEKVFLVIEEPEAHLFPIAQKSLVELITLLFNENECQVMITTHSPYILTAFNNLIYAGNVGPLHENEIGRVIPKLLWLDVNKVGAYRLGGGQAENLMDEETHLMRVEEIDTVSQSINEDFDAILNLELQ
jgi:AAA ATPase-like protein